ncbi:MAG: ATP-binding protein [Deltaproteobacteria bacterium]|nr:ATP-binding protein [Deltaproteobacteria bacterium]
MDSDNYISRTIEEYAFDEALLGRHMVFLAGPRQVGKTWLARHWLAKKSCSSLYFNWDDIATRKAYLKDNRFFESPARNLGVDDPWIVFDEIHKRHRWRDILKGAYDLFGEEFRFLITGSARLDLFRRSGDSLVGRYNLFHMMPLSLGEVVHERRTSCFLEETTHEAVCRTFEREISGTLDPEIVEACADLHRYGPFPEPFFRQNDRFCRKWHQDYITLIVREDLRDISRVVELDKVEHLLFLMPSRIMSPLSMPGLARDLEVAHTTVKNWLEQLRRLYILFAVSPWKKKISRGLKKEKKWYFLDWYYAPDGSARLENMVATYLYRACLSMTDMGYGDYHLHYIRTLDKKEIDFLVVRDNRPLMAVEVKASDTAPSKTVVERHRWSVEPPTLGIQVVDQRGVLKKYKEYTWVLSLERLLHLLV